MIDRALVKPGTPVRPIPVRVRACAVNFNQALYLLNRRAQS